MVFHRRSCGNTDVMTEANKNSAKRVTSTAGKKAGAAGNRAKQSSARTASKAKATTRDAGTAAKSAGTAAKSAGVAAKSGVQSAGTAATRVGEAAAQGVESGQKALVSTAGKATSAAATTWTVVKHRKAIVSGAAAGVVGICGAAFALGRQTAKS